MALRLGDIAPDFIADSTQGRINFHRWIGDSWAILFSHPRDFTPICTTELGYVARLKPELDRRGVKAIGRSIDPVDVHAKWSEDIRATQGHAPNFPDRRRFGQDGGQPLRHDPPPPRRGVHRPHGLRDRSRDEDPPDDHLPRPPAATSTRSCA